MSDLYNRAAELQAEILMLEGVLQVIERALQAKCKHDLVHECVDSTTKDPCERVIFRICAQCGLEGRFGKNKSVNTNEKAVVLGRVQWRSYHQWKYSRRSPFTTHTEGWDLL